VKENRFLISYGLNRYNHSGRSHLAPESQPIQDAIDALLFRCYGLSDDDPKYVNSEQIIACNSGKQMGLQIADAVASSAYYAVQPSLHGYTEDRYIRMLKPVIYHYQGRYLGYGLKFWPREVDEQMEKKDELRWVRVEFK